MTGTERGEERRRLLRAVRSGDETESASEHAGGSERPEPAPDGGTVAIDASPARCASCDRTYQTAPGRCDDCGSETFVKPEPFASEEIE